MDTLLLDPTTWDLALDVDGNVAVETGKAALAQDAASAIRLHRGELWYDTTQGVPWFAAILGKNAPASLVKAHLASAALTVPTVKSAQVFVTAIVDRKLSGQVQITDESGATAAAGF